MEELIKIILEGYPKRANKFHLEGEVDSDGLNTKQFYLDDKNEVVESMFSSSDKFKMYDLIELMHEDLLKQSSSLDTNKFSG